MRYFDFLENADSIFYRVPEKFSLNSPREVLSHSLGAALYMPAVRKSIVEDILYKKHPGIRTMVLCLEDAVSKRQLSEAETNLVHIFNQLQYFFENQPDLLEDIPLIFVRVRNLQQFELLLNKSKFTGLCGFIFPKFDSMAGEDYLRILKEYNIRNSRNLYGMPILETSSIIYKESRTDELHKIKSILDDYREYILNIRVGGTDLSGIYGLRRGKDYSIYDLVVVRDCISDIINVFKRDGYVISGPVFEYFNRDNELDNPGLLRETLLDLTNGFTGKTVIHPSQVNLVNSLMVVAKEEYLDAKNILKSSDDGVIKSSYSNKMNEIKPHTKWARNIIMRAKVMGVYNDGKGYEDILRASNKLQHRQRYDDIIEYHREQI